MRWRFRPSKPQAIFSAIAGVAILVLGITSVKAGAFLVVWCAIGVGVIGMNLWAAFGRNGSLYTAESDDGEPPKRLGQRAEPMR